MLIPAKQKKILSILADGQFHSGSELAEKIAISRSAICKQISKITELGLDICAITGKGYRLEHAIQLLSKSEIEQQVNPVADALIAKLEIHDIIKSTNSYLFELPNKATENGIVCVAEFQEGGKGRRGRTWISPFGSNIYLSILWNFQNGSASINGLSLAVGVAVIQTLKNFGIDDVGLKWPNDILWRGKKLAGILIEVSGEANGPCTAVIGLGLNIYLPKKSAEPITQDWVDLKQIVSENVKIDRNQLIAGLLNQLMPTIANFEDDTLANYLDAWRNYDCMKEKEVDIYIGEQSFTGTVKGIDDNGLLLLTDQQGDVRKFASGEVSFHRP